MTTIDDFWNKLISMEEELTDEEIEQCRERALDNTPVNVDGFKDTNQYQRNYFKELSRKYWKNERGEE